MKRTPQYFRRESIKEVFNKILKNEKTVLRPSFINILEDPLKEDYTLTSFKYNDSSLGLVSVSESRGRGFVDSLFKGLYDQFVTDYPSLETLTLRDLQVNPLMASRRASIGTDAMVSISLLIEVKKHGKAEFHHESHSVISSVFSAALDVFQFYINCERCFNKIQLIIQDAASRNRADIIEGCKFDLSKLTEVNSYEKGKKKH